MLSHILMVFLSAPSFIVVCSLTGTSEYISIDAVILHILFDGSRLAEIVVSACKGKHDYEDSEDQDASIILLGLLFFSSTLFASLRAAFGVSSVCLFLTLCFG